MTTKHPFEPFPDTDAECFIQWKGTEVCIDVWCKCGEDCHFDGDFAYHLQCPKCNTIYELGTQVKMKETTAPKAQVKMMELQTDQL